MAFSKKKEDTVVMKRLSIYAMKSLISTGIFVNNAFDFGPITGIKGKNDVLVKAYKDQVLSTNYTSGQIYSIVN